VSAPGSGQPDDAVEEVRADVLAARTEVAETVEQLAARLNPKNQARRLAARVVASAKTSAIQTKAAVSRRLNGGPASGQGVLIRSDAALPVPTLAVAGVTTAALLLMALRHRRHRR
jgi:Protein of unknown function (DUF3618)